MVLKVPSHLEILHRVILQEFSLLSLASLELQLYILVFLELFQSSLLGIFSGAESEDASPEGMAPTDEMQNSSNLGEIVPTGPDSYVEVTDNQVAGVIEGDLFKRTKTRQAETKMTSRDNISLSNYLFSIKFSCQSNSKA